MADSAEYLGHILRKELSTLPKDKVLLTRGKGLLNAIVIDQSKSLSVCNLICLYVTFISNWICTVKHSLVLKRCNILHSIRRIGAYFTV